MTKDDANYLLGLAQANFGYAFKDMTASQKVLMVDSWAFGLQDIPADIVMLAFMQLVTKSKWVPTVAEIREQVKDIGMEARSGLDYGKGIEYLARVRLGKEVHIHNADGDAIRRYIVENTAHLMGQDGPGLQLDTIIRGRNMTSIGSGQMGFGEIGEGKYESGTSGRGNADR